MKFTYRAVVLSLCSVFGSMSVPAQADPLNIVFAPNQVWTGVKHTAKLPEPNIYNLIMNTGNVNDTLTLTSSGCMPAQLPGMGPSATGGTNFYGTGNTITIKDGVHLRNGIIGSVAVDGAVPGISNGINDTENTVVNIEGGILDRNAFSYAEARDPIGSLFNPGSTDPVVTAGVARHKSRDNLIKMTGGALCANASAGDASLIGGLGGVESLNNKVIIDGGDSRAIEFVALDGFGVSFYGGMSTVSNFVDDTLADYRHVNGNVVKLANVDLNNVHNIYGGLLDVGSRADTARMTAQVNDNVVIVDKTCTSDDYESEPTVSWIYGGYNRMNGEVKNNLIVFDGVKNINDDNTTLIAGMLTSENSTKGLNIVQGNTVWLTNTLKASQLIGGLSSDEGRALGNTVYIDLEAGEKLYLETQSSQKNIIGGMSYFEASDNNIVIKAVDEDAIQSAGRNKHAKHLFIAGFVPDAFVFDSPTTYAPETVANGNTFTFDGQLGRGDSSDNVVIAGGLAQAANLGNANNNVVSLTGDIKTELVVGGGTWMGDAFLVNKDGQVEVGHADNNTIIVNEGTKVELQKLYGGVADGNDADASSASNNRISLNTVSGSDVLDLYGGYLLQNGQANGNSVFIDGDGFSVSDEMAAARVTRDGSAADNVVSIKGTGHYFQSLYVARVDNGEAVHNVLLIDGEDHNIGVYAPVVAGYARGAVRDNLVSVSGKGNSFDQALLAAETYSDSGSDNLVILDGEKHAFRQSVNAVRMHNSGTATGNALLIKGSSLEFGPSGHKKGKLVAAVDLMSGSADENVVALTGHKNTFAGKVAAVYSNDRATFTNNTVLIDGDSNKFIDAVASSCSQTGEAQHNSLIINGNKNVFAYDYSGKLPQASAVTSAAFVKNDGDARDNVLAINGSDNRFGEQVSAASIGGNAGTVSGNVTVINGSNNEFLETVAAADSGQAYETDASNNHLMINAAGNRYYGTVYVVKGKAEQADGSTMSIAAGLAKPSADGTVFSDFQDQSVRGAEKNSSLHDVGLVLGNQNGTTRIGSLDHFDYIDMTVTPKNLKKTDQDYQHAVIYLTGNDDANTSFQDTQVKLKALKAEGIFEKDQTYCLMSGPFFNVSNVDLEGETSVKLDTGLLVQTFDYEIYDQDGGYHKVGDYLFEEYDGSQGSQLNLINQTAAPSPDAVVVTKGHAAAMGLWNEFDLLVLDDIDAGSHTSTNDWLKFNEKAKPFGIISEGWMNYGGASDLDMRGRSAAVGITGIRPNRNGGTFKVSPFLQGAWGSYEASKTAKVSADGDNYYAAMGAAWRYMGAEQKWYQDGEVRLGWDSMELTGHGFDEDIKGRVGTTAGTVILGFGYKLYQSEARNLDLYARYHYAHLGERSLKAAGHTIKLKRTLSQRVLLGSRYVAQPTDTTNYFVGAGLENEFSGQFRASVDGEAMETYSTRGLSGFGEVGLSWAPKVNEGWDLSVKLRGYKGKRNGVIGYFSAIYRR